jgi:acetyl-CoA carboxylase biotin carboxyl carrier protein
MADERTIKSPLPGTFYRAPEEGGTPYVKEGDVVQPGDVVGLVEVMKTFTELKAEHEGVIDRFLVESGDPVDAGQDVVMLGD